MRTKLRTEADRTSVLEHRKRKLSEQMRKSDFLMSNLSFTKLLSLTSFGGYSECDPPDPIPNSAVKPLSADDSVGVPM